jgi:hypothetical protein
MLGMIAALIALLHFSPIQNPESTEFIVTGASHALNNTLIQLLVALSFILIVTRIFGGLAKAIGEPAVVGEIFNVILHVLLLELLQVSFYLLLLLLT